MAFNKILRKVVLSSMAPTPIGPYSQAILIDRTLYLSGVIGVDKRTGKLVEGGVVAEMKQVLQNMQHILKEAGTNIDKVVKTTILLKNLDNYTEVNDIYKEAFKNEYYPARSAFEVSKLPMGAQVEIEAIAIVGEVETVKSSL